RQKTLTAKIDFIKLFKHVYPIKLMCKVLKVNRSTVYKIITRVGQGFIVNQNHNFFVPAAEQVSRTNAQILTIFGSAAHLPLFLTPNQANRWDVFDAINSRWNGNLPTGQTDNRTQAQIHLAMEANRREMHNVVTNNFLSRELREAGFAYTATPFNFASAVINSTFVNNQEVFVSGSFSVSRFLQFTVSSIITHWAYATVDATAIQEESFSSFNAERNGLTTNNIVILEGFHEPLVDPVKITTRSLMQGDVASVVISAEYLNDQVRKIVITIVLNDWVSIRTEIDFIVNR
ncbi:MAG: hypothetical protein FWE36_01325, partial [Erysipelotrichales bacterium]|nr:hypothetical protein [Erysipelotrichales bacterium]